MIPFLPFLFLIPLAASAATLKEVVDSQIIPLGDAVVSLLYALAFIFFLIGMLRFFYTTNPEEQNVGKQHMLWGILGLVVLFSVWGLVKLLMSVLPGAGA